MAVSSVPAAGGPWPLSHRCTYNQANQRSRATLGDNRFWTYQYDALRQIKSAKREWEDFVLVT